VFHACNKTIFQRVRFRKNDFPRAVAALSAMSFNAFKSKFAQEYSSRVVLVEQVLHKLSNLGGRSLQSLYLSDNGRAKYDCVRITVHVFDLCRV
jgi:hypothetical protein